MIKEILGTETWQAFTILLFFAFVGVAISLLIHANNRDPQSASTPYQFSFKFLLLDNWKRIALNLLLIYVTIRFFTDITGLQLKSFYALAIGIGYDQLAKVVKDKTNILCVNREAITKP